MQSQMMEIGFQGRGDFKLSQEDSLQKWGFKNDLAGWWQRLLGESHYTAGVGMSGWAPRGTCRGLLEGRVEGAQESKGQKAVKPNHRDFGISSSCCQEAKLIPALLSEGVSWEITVGLMDGEEGLWGDQKPQRLDLPGGQDWRLPVSFRAALHTLFEGHSVVCGPGSQIS